MVELNLIIKQLSWSPVAWKFPMQSITSKTGHSYMLMYGADTHIKWEFQAAMGIFSILERTLRTMSDP